MTDLSQHPYAPFLARVAKPNRYTGAEFGARRKAWDAVEARVCLAFPEVYDIGMSHLGYRILYKLLNDDPRTLAERCYAPWTDLQAELRAHGQLLVSLESARPLCDFDVVGMSLQFELTYTTVLSMLELGGVPLRAAARGDDDPLVVAGGPVATHAEPMAPFFDAILVGDGEEAAGEIALTWVRARREGLSREERLLRLAALPGVYVPSLYATALDPESGLEVVTGPRPDLAGRGVPFPVERRLVADLDRFPFPDDGPVGGPEAIFDRLSVEVARGCTEGCRFCQAGMIYRPVRERDPAQVIETVTRALEKSGQDQISLTALSTADVSCISPLIKRLVERTAPERVSLSVASLRAYCLGEDLLDAMRQVRASGLTFAPEAGTQRMRDVINKNVTEAQLLETAERTFSRGFDRMKLYFICGLPTEEDEDVLGIVEVGRRALAVGKRHGVRATVTVSVSVHVPKPHTPFQWCAMDTPEEIGRKQALLREAARGVKGLTLRQHDEPSSVLEGILARGDRRLAAVIEDAFRAGAQFDTWGEHLRLDAWRAAFEVHGVDTRVYLGTLPVGARLPWDHLDIGLEDGFLAREYRKALQSRLSIPCGKVAGAFVHAPTVEAHHAEQGRLVCYDCGVACDMGRMRSRRLGFLEGLGARGTDPLRLPVISAPGATPAPDPGVGDGPEGSAAPAVLPSMRRAPHPEAHRPRREGTPVKLRLAFAKVGPTALLGHLDLLREIPRVLRRAGLRTAYSLGYHPKAALSFGPALSLGIASLDEHVDVTLLDPPEVEQVVAALNRASAPGLEWREGRVLGTGDPGLSRIITGARYVIGLAAPTVAALGGEAELGRRVAAFLERDSAIVLRQIEGIGKKVDVRSFVRALRLDRPEGTSALVAAGLRGALVPLVTEVSILGSGAVKVSEVVHAVTGEPALPHVAVRARLLAGEGSPLDLERHRQVRLGRPATERVDEVVVG